jgi:tRNA A-37 threonylcarbamoyl transferase component Bud32
MSTPAPASPADPDLLPGQLVGEYMIEGSLGRGAFGQVFRARHPLIGKQVAIKVLKPELCANQASIDRFVQEAQAVNKIGHPNIVDVFSLGELPDGRAYFVMEWLRGEDLKTRLARGPMSVADACDILDGIAHALDAAHAKEIVHRDLKPDNVFLHQVENGPLMVKLLDFGIAKLVRSTPGTEKTQTGNMLGTPRYMSPEQARGIQVDHRSDIYSLGVIAYEMIAHRTPFEAETAMDLVVKHISDAPPPLHDFAKVPKALEQCVMAMLAKDPAKRPTLTEVRNILIDPSRRITPLPTMAHVVSTAIPRVVARRRWPIFLLALIGSVGMGAVTWTLVQRQTQPSGQPAAPALATVTPTERPVEPPQAGSSTEKTTPPVPVPTRGTLEVEVAGAKDSVIYVDDEEWGRGASIKVELDPGNHAIAVKPPGRAAITQKVDIVAGQVNKITVVVPKAPVATRKIVRTKKDKTKPKPSGDDELLAPKRNR